MLCNTLMVSLVMKKKPSLAARIARTTDLVNFSAVSSQELGLLRVATAARAIGVSRQYLNVLVRERRLRAFRFFRTNFVSVRELLQYRTLHPIRRGRNSGS
jgi:hypothetical protein